MLHLILDTEMEPGIETETSSCMANLEVVGLDAEKNRLKSREQ